MKLNKRFNCRTLLESETPIMSLKLSGWVRTKRQGKDFAFIELNDGSCLANLQIVVPETCSGYEEISKTSTGASVMIEGDLVKSPGKNQQWEMLATDYTIVGICDSDYPLQKKRHSDEFLRQIAHLRPRTNKFGAIARIRSRLSYIIHQYFQERDFHLVNTPIITGSDCEGAGEMFSVTSTKGSIKSDDFFDRPAHLTVSGQLSVETYCLALGKVYTFGPTFRAENSNTSRHISEFWMIEPEVAFNDLRDNMELVENFLQSITSQLMEESEKDLNLFKQFVDKDLERKLEQLVSSKFERATYTECINLLAESDCDFQYKPYWGADLQSEHERFLTEKYFKGPLFVTDWPKKIKPFYMRENDDNTTVASMDLLVPGTGELVGGSVREERLDRLRTALNNNKLNEKDYWWYIDTRRFGSAPHAGFGVGFERLLMFLTGTSNIRDVIPFPRTPKHLDF